MAELNFEPQQEHRESGGFDPLPNGTYEAQIIDSDWHETKKRDGQYLKIQLEILGPEFAGRRLFENLNLQNASAQAVEIAERTLTQICDALGKPRVGDSEELHFQPMMIEVGTRPAKDQYGPSNTVRAYKAKGNGQQRQAAFKKQPPKASSSKSPPWAQSKAG